MRDQQPTDQCAALAPLIPALALDGTPEGLDSDLAAHLEQCPHCRQELAAHRRIAGLLPLTAPDALPDPRLRADVVEAVAAAAVGRPRRSRGSWLRLPRLAGGALRRGLAAALALLLVGWGGLAQYQQWSAGRLQAQQSRLLAAILADPQLLRFPLVAESPGGSGALLATPDDAQAALVVSGLPPLPEGMVYQLWIVRDEQRTSGGTFVVGPRGEGTLLVTLPAPLASIDRVGVTLEPAGGSPAPTSGRVIGGSLVLP